MKGKSLNDWNDIKHVAILTIKANLGFEPKESEGVPTWVRKFHYKNGSKYRNNFDRIRSLN